jgi:hypothetical protein
MLEVGEIGRAMVGEEWAGRKEGGDGERTLSVEGSRVPEVEESFIEEGLRVAEDWVAVMIEATEPAVPLDAIGTADEE